jgi:uncharacterized membrane protein
LLILLGVIGLSIWAYPQLPLKVVTHWNFYSQPDGWSSRNFHVLFFPALLIFIYALLSIVPKFDKRGNSYPEFAGVYIMIRNIVLLFLAFIFLVTTLYNLGYAINIAGTVAGAVGALMIILGNYFVKLKRNSVVGIRTGWSLYSENTWNKTHRFGSRVFMIWGVGIIIAPWLQPVFAFWILFGGVAFAAIGTIVASYIFYKKEKDNEKMLKQ